MTTELPRDAITIRYGIYSLAFLAAMLLIGFLYLFNFTTFFRLAPM